MKNNSIIRSAFRRQVAAEETMIRSAMPRTAVADAEPLAALGRVSVAIANNGSSRLVRLVPSLTFTISEVARG